MVYKCCAPNCRGNYDKNGPKVHMFRFPKDDDQKKKWLKFIKREETFTVTNNTRLCQNHFQPEDIVKHQRIFDTKKGVFVEVTLEHPYLKKDAKPVFLPDCPKYCSKEVSKPRVSREDRLKEKEDVELVQCIAESVKAHEEYEKSNSFSNLDEFREKLKKKNGEWKHWTILYYEKKVAFVKLIHDPIVKVICSVVIDIDCNITVFNDVLEFSKFDQKVTNFNQFEKLLNDVWLLFGENESDSDNEPESRNSRIKNYICAIENALNTICELLPEDEQKTIHYLIEQVKFLSVSHHTRYRYSSELMVLASIFHSISPHAYKFVRSSKLVTLPHPTTIRKVCAKYDHVNPLNEQNEDGFLGYVKLRYKQLPEKERLVMLLMDEIHLKSYLDFKAGNIVGSAYNTNEVAKTAFVFMIKSFLSKFKEVAHILPVKTMTGEQLHTFLLKLLQGLHAIGFKVLCIISDNNAVNSKAVSLFSTPPALKISYPHPFEKDIALFFLFDSVHIIKCVRNNWINKKDDQQTFIFPEFDVNSNEKYSATFHAIQQLYYSEDQQLVKYGYTLNLKSLFPSNLERQNVRFVLNVFNDFVKEGLLAHGEIANSESTAQFLEIMINWWSVVNTKTIFKGVRRKNALEYPLTVGNEPYRYLHSFLAWVRKWKELDQNYSLTRETMTAITQTTDALIQLCDYVCGYLNMEYLLPGKVQTDSLEERFGGYRTMAGGQYLITLRQILEIEKKIRLQNFLPLTLSSKSLGNVPIGIEDVPVTVEDITENDFILDYNFEYEFDFDHNFEDLEKLIPNLTFIGGACLRSSLKRISCTDCSNYWIIKEEEVQSQNEPQGYDLIAKMNRGGLIFPKPDVAIVIAITYHVVSQLTNEKNEDKFLKNGNQRKLIMSVVHRIVNSELTFQNQSNKCQEELHNEKLLKFLIKSATNTLLDKYVKIRNDRIKEPSANNNSRKRKLETFKG